MVALIRSKSPHEKVEQVYGPYRKELQRFFKRFSMQPDAAEDLVQGAYLRLLKYGSLDEIRDPVTFIYSIAWNLLRSENRRAAREQRRNISIDDHNSEEVVNANDKLWVVDSPVDVDRAEFERVIGQLPPEQRDVFSLHSKGYTRQEISLRTGINEHTVKKYIARVKAYLHRRYTTGACE
jgi:RNA polymerase sigma factor (sigma-70 family)